MASPAPRYFLSVDWTRDLPRVRLSPALSADVSAGRLRLPLLARGWSLLDSFHKASSRDGFPVIDADSIGMDL